MSADLPPFLPQGTIRPAPSHSSGVVGNRGGRQDDKHRVNCATTTEVLSAGLDGEAGETERLAAEEHLAGCADCRRWYAEVTTLTRSVRVMPVDSGPDVTEVVLPAWRPRRRDRLRGRAGRRLRGTLRALLAAVALVQFGMAVLQITGAGVDVYGNPVPGAPMPHVDHETGAWNAAVAVAMAWVAARARHAAAHLPVLVSFGCVLAGLCLLDLGAGQVGVARVLSHLPVLLGILLVAGLAALHSEQVRPGSPSAGHTEPAGVPGDRHGAVSPLTSAGPAPPPVAHRRSA